MTIYLPIVLTVVAIIRMYGWWNLRDANPSLQHIIRDLGRTNLVAVLLAGCFACWAVVLFPYGNAYAQGHVVFFLGITLTGCMFCLMHVRFAALGVTVIANIALLFVVVTSGNTVLAAKALNVLLVSSAILVILWVSYRDFEDLIASRKTLLQQQKELVKKQEETQRLSDDNFQLANLDSLTDLPNRRSFYAKLEEFLAEDASQCGTVTVGLLDLDGFKAVNDIYGHSVGDQLLREVGTRLASVCADEVYLARLGGDEFGLLLRNAENDQRVQDLGDKICSMLQVPFEYLETVLVIGGSIGFASKPEECCTGNKLYEMADYALYRAKKNNPGTAQLYGAEHESEIWRTRKIEQGFYASDFASQISVHFQPVVSVETNRILACEALARWDHPSLGSLSPEVFIGVAERCGFIEKLTEILFKKALAHAELWPKDIRLSFNLSAKNVGSLQYASRLAGLIRESGFDPARIDFEITETAMIRDFDMVLTVIFALKKIGARISLDDFGTGFSSLKYLHNIPLDKIKIDRSFVTGIQKGTTGYGIVKSLIKLSRDMGIGCIIEGVETEDEFKVVRNLGASMVQGYYCYKPMPAEQARERLNSQKSTAMANFG
ncbi:putative bifunctional diguanylate cyclase/phosphodiesterase [Roseibium algae]|uniref:EAL domain-containing protein n=1 Tax=Roseibium algae TaxID=3123038 RepID=A0ABU8TJ44_9HYPH